MSYELLKKYEGFASKDPNHLIVFSPNEIETMQDYITIYPYRCAAGKWTIGWGCRIDENKEEFEKYKNGCSKKECDELFETKIKSFEQCVEHELGALVLHPKQNEALTTLCYNIGTTNFSKSTLLKVIKKDHANFEEIGEEWRKWCYANGKKLNGLVRRREEEFGQYKYFHNLLYI